MNYVYQQQDCFIKIFFSERQIKTMEINVNKIKNIVINQFDKYMQTSKIQKTKT